MDIKKFCDHIYITPEYAAMMEEAIEAIAKIIPADYEIIDNGDGTFTHSFNFRDPWIPPVTQ